MCFVTYQLQDLALIVVSLCISQCLRPLHELVDVQVDSQTGDEQFQALAKYAVDLTAKASVLDPVRPPAA